MSSCTSYVSRIHNVIGDVIRLQSRSNFEIAISPVNISDIAPIKSSKYRKCLWLSYWYIQRLVSLPVQKTLTTSNWHFSNVNIFNAASNWHQLWKKLKIVLYIHAEGSLVAEASCKCNISSMNATILIAFVRYTCLKKISISKTFQDRRPKVKVTGLQSDLGTQTAVTPSILGVSRWNKNWNVGNSYGYVATATKIRFHFRFPRPPDTAFGGDVGLL